MKKILLLALLIGNIFLLNSCSGKKNTIVFDNSDPLSTDVEIQWAIITDPYAACRSEPSYQAETINHFRKGVLVQVKGQQTVKTDDLYEKWYNFDEGWVTGSALKIYSNKLRAQKALKEMGF